MFCYQCERAAKGIGCTIGGVCGKEPQVAALQDLLLYATKGLSMYAHRARELGVQNRDVDVFVLDALFSTVTNVDFDVERLKVLLARAVQLRAKVQEMYGLPAGRAHT